MSFLLALALVVYAQAAPARHVILVSMDGAKPAVMETAEMPNFKALKAMGAHATEAWTIYPSLTLPSHTSMITGVEPEVHRIVWNDYRPGQGVVRTPTIFQEAKRASLTTALVTAKEKFRHLHVPGSIDHFELLEADAMPIAQTATRLFLEKRPHLLMVHFADPDRAGHKFGWGSNEQKEALAQTDLALGRLLAAVRGAGLENQTVWLLTADHGGTGRGHGSRSRSDSLIPWVVAGPGVRSGFAIPGRVSTKDTAATVLSFLGIGVPAGWSGRALNAIFQPLPRQIANNPIP